MMPSEPDRSLGDPEAIRRLLRQPEAGTILTALKARDPEAVRSAAQAALKGDSAALGRLLGDLSRDPKAKQAMERLDRATR